jgi:hypothetical protein
MSEKYRFVGGLAIRDEIGHRAIRSYSSPYHTCPRFVAGYPLLSLAELQCVAHQRFLFTITEKNRDIDFISTQRKNNSD